MRTEQRPGRYDRDVVRPTLWGYATSRTTGCLLGDVPGLPRHLEGRTDVVVPGLTPDELEHLQRHAAWRATARPGRLALTAPLVAGVTVLVATWALAGRPLPLVALVVAAVVLANVHGIVYLLRPRLSRTERHALRRAVEIRRTHSAAGSSTGMHVLVAMSTVEGAADALGETARALARELLWSAVEAARRHDDDGVRHATSAMIRLAARAVQASPDGVPDEPPA